MRSYADCSMSSLLASESKRYRYEGVMVVLGSGKTRDFDAYFFYLTRVPRLTRAPLVVEACFYIIVGKFTPVCPVLNSARLTIGLLLRLWAV